MTGIQSLSAAHIVVLAATLCAKADYAGLQVLQSQRADILGAKLCCRILLTFLSGNEQPDCYISLLKQLCDLNTKPSPEELVELSDVEGLSEQDARQRILSMKLEPLGAQDAKHSDSISPVANFVMEQAYRIDAESGDLTAVCQLVEPFIGDSEFLRRWSTSWRIEHDALESSIFKAMLTANHYQAAISVYLRETSSRPLPTALIEKLVEKEILNAYDNSSNGNRGRGGMKRASEILKAFRPHFPPSSSVNKIEKLLAATHALSFYQLTLQHGVPFQPVSIRVHHDPISLISKILEQNPDAYTKLDDLVSIGRDIVAAELQVFTGKDTNTPPLPSPERSLESKMLETDRRIIYEAIISSLFSNDFDTAYSYVLTRLSPSPQPSQTAEYVDDVSWRAAYAAGRYRATTPRGTTDRADQVALASKKLDLLSLSLTLVPDPTQLSSMLATWQRCEAELNDLQILEAAEEKAWDERGDHITSVPGGFGLEDREGDLAETRRARDRRKAAISGRKNNKQEEAPMGLFEVAREAATAIGKTAFPLKRVAGTPGIKEREPMGDAPVGPVREHASGTLNNESAEDAHERLRKRDMVSNMVTGGLVSGLGWVLGAQPADRGSNVASPGDMGNT